jgi:hypothetical protein
MTDAGIKLSGSMRNLVREITGYDCNGNVTELIGPKVQLSRDSVFNVVWRHVWYHSDLVNGGESQRDVFLRKYGERIGKWVEDNIDLIGEIGFCAERNGNPEA